MLSRTSGSFSTSIARSRSAGWPSRTCAAWYWGPRVTHEVRSVTSQIAYVGCGQGVALVPSAMRKLAPENVVVRPLKEKVMIVTAALVWNTHRHHPMVDEAVSWLKERMGKHKNSAEL
nr:LysR substrate-binding domain-containing protein [Paraburkholderia ribeironis]